MAHDLCSGLLAMGILVIGLGWCLSWFGIFRGFWTGFWAGFFTRLFVGTLRPPGGGWGLGCALLLLAVLLLLGLMRK